MIKATPMIQQYLEIKSQYADALLLYRMGDFYELFMEDAVTASRLLEIALTSRDKQAENPVPMCGVPYHAAEGYIAKLVAAGHKVAVCDQVEDPKKAKGLVRREVTRVITPGLILESTNLSAKEPNYLAAVVSAGKDQRYGLAYLDISTADFKAVELDSEQVLAEELIRVSPKEILIPNEADRSFLPNLPQRCRIAVTELDPIDFDGRRAEERLIRHFQVHSLEGFGIQGMDLSVRAAGAILAYVEANLLGSCNHITKLLPYNRADYMILDEATVRNLEIFESASFQERKGSLLHVLDLTQTAMGGRRLQQWMRYPLLNFDDIEVRQEAVAELVENTTLRTEMRELLGKINDIERLNGRNSAGASGPRDLTALKRSLLVLPHLLGTISPCGARKLTELADSWDDLSDVAGVIEATLTDPPPVNASAGGVVRQGVNAELDHYVSLNRDGKSWMTEYEAAERRRTGISSLKVRYNKVFGYYIEISNANLPAAPRHYVRKQTLVNAERFITEELKNFETQVLEADEKRLQLEQEIFAELRKTVAKESERIQKMAQRVSELDCLAALAEVAARFDYCRPGVDRSDAIHIKEGRHPVIEHFLQEGAFVPNDLDMDQESRQVLIITGPNMAGKSTILRQAALIVLMAQIGSFVPASEARIGLVDRIFTRVGASDDLARGRSTFMVEMQEAANILHSATPRSLIILDEIGRGTSTFDGMSIAWAVAEHLHGFGGVGVKTLFATHYHELTELTRTLPRVKNFNVAVKEWQHEIVFFHKLVPGGTNRSYGIQVARLAGMPGEVIERAREILAHLQNGEAPFLLKSTHSKKKGKLPKDHESAVQLTLFRPSVEWLRDRILGMDLDRMTPLSALQTLYALKGQIRGGDGSGTVGDAGGHEGLRHEKDSSITASKDVQ
jgi:DNA mismatch repair protein MutS